MYNRIINMTNLTLAVLILGHLTMIEARGQKERIYAKTPPMSLNDSAEQDNLIEKYHKNAKINHD